MDGLNSIVKVEPLIKSALAECDIVFCEGLKLHSFGIAVQKALFAADRSLYIMLHAQAKVLNERLKCRSGTNVSKDILLDQKHTLNAAKKFANIGTCVLAFDTGVFRTEDIVNLILKEIQKWDVMPHQDGVPK